MVDRRIGERRRALISVRYPDRRHGFPRRTPRGPILKRYLGGLEAIRDNSNLVVLLATLLLTLNIADLNLTRIALDAGAVEVNPFMAALFESDFALATAVKLGLSAFVVGGLWLMRRYRAALSLLVIASVAMGVLVTYQALLVAAIT
ncbi:MAG: DUF5658 family protein [Acidimicrobiia bacterium]|nr:DUF5658 family protein [Acidimicrobiia bacterium]